MKLKKIFFISGFCIIIFLLISCGENKQKPDFTVSNNITNGKIQNDDTLTIRVNSINKNLSGISFEIKSNNKVCLLYTSPSPRDLSTSRMPSSA